MNSKPEFIKKASEICDYDTFIWLDFGVLKNIKDTNKFLNKLKICNNSKFSKVLIPGS